MNPFTFKANLEQHAVEELFILIEREQLARRLLWKLCRLLLFIRWSSIRSVRATIYVSTLSVRQLGKLIRRRLEATS